MISFDDADFHSLNFFFLLTSIVWCHFTNLHCLLTLQNLCMMMTKCNSCWRFASGFISP